MSASVARAVFCVSAALALLPLASAVPVPAKLSRGRDVSFLGGQGAEKGGAVALIPNGPMMMNKTLMDEKDLPVGSRNINGVTEVADWQHESPVVLPQAAQQRNFASWQR